MPKKSVENQEIDKNDFFEKKNRSSAPEWKTQKNSDNLYPIYFKKIDKKMSSIFFSNRLNALYLLGTKQTKGVIRPCLETLLVKFLYRIHGAVTALQFGASELRSG